MDDEQSRRGPDEVLHEYLEADSPEDWLINEVCSYLFESVPSGELDERINAFDEMIAAERDRLLDDGPELDDVVLYTVTVSHGEDEEDEEEFLSFRSCPSPALLMEACVHMAEPGELVRVDMVYGDASHSTATLVWPFPIQVAVEVTTAMRRELDEDDLAFYEFVASHEGPEDDGSDVGAKDGTADARDRPRTGSAGHTRPSEPGREEPATGPRPTGPAPAGTVALAATGGALLGVLTGLAAARRLLAAVRGRS